MMTFAFHLIETDGIILIERFISTEECCAQFPMREIVDETPSVRYMVGSSHMVVTESGMRHFVGKEHRILPDVDARYWHVPRKTIERSGVCFHIAGIL